ncbi:thioredoxin domain-containing protein [Flavobacterium sp. F-65]|uniref:Thioredoxin domain-containing protein n=1 Tax=Flavobacterium pisciphilum TaxID=2893755 RepID=A0ABS8MTV1_9FLAO|nr:thioredoxin domain-containing protein [Flavobacterium sp. F-65]MCC9071606.1 thioredoxin domain-containing protein [Flavobacterium sp. F-65]
MKSPKVLLIIIAFVLASCNGQSSKNIEIIEPSVFAEKLSATQKPLILDVRTPEEYTAEHIENAVNVDWKGKDFATKAATFDKSKPVFVYCLSGGRSKKAAQKLQELGFTTIYELDGGIIKWNAEGFTNANPNNKTIGMTSQEYETLLNSDKKVLVDFYAEWCGPCKQMTPYLTKMQKELADKVVIIRIDVDKNKTLVKNMKIDQLPTLILYENKEVKWKNTGFISETDLKKQL